MLSKVVQARIAALRGLQAQLAREFKKGPFNGSVRITPSTPVNKEGSGRGLLMT